MTKITLEELEHERVDKTKVKGEAYCSTNSECEHRGEFIRCYLDTCVNCPYYVSNKEIKIYDPGEDKIGRIDDLSQAGGYYE